MDGARRPRPSRGIAAAIAAIVVVIVVVVGAVLVVAHRRGPGSTPPEEERVLDGDGDGRPADPPGFPDGRSVECPTATVHVRTADELRAALGAAKAGDHIELAPGTYEGAFVASAPGTEAAPVFLCGPRDAVLDGGGTDGHYVVHLDGARFWRLVGFTVRNGQKGIVADDTTNSVIQEITVEDIGDEGVHLRAASTFNAVQRNTVRRTGLRKAEIGEGVYVGTAVGDWEKISGGEPDRSDYNLVLGNLISDTGAESVDIKEGTTGGKVVANVMDGSTTTGADSLVDVKGNEWLIEGNTGQHGPSQGMQTHRILDGWGSRNVFRRNSIGVDGDGLDIYVQDEEATRNRVYCDNTDGSGAALRTNVTCRPGRG